MYEPRRRGPYSAVIVGVVLALLVVIVVFRSGPRSEEMRKAAAPTIRAIEQYVAQHGRYPASLGVIGKSAPLTAYGHYHYRVTPDGSRCSLSVGSRFRDGFVLTWDCTTRLWTTNPALHVGPSVAAQPDSAVLSEPDDTTPSHQPSV
ncbi:MAG TPA: hypothetical protein VF166_07470 [Gemmatimonadaceae bacterium]